MAFSKKRTLLKRTTVGTASLLLAGAFSVWWWNCSCQPGKQWIVGTWR